MYLVYCLCALFVWFDLIFGQNVMHRFVHYISDLSISVLMSVDDARRMYESDGEPSTSMSFFRPVKPV